METKNLKLKVNSLALNRRKNFFLPRVVFDVLDFEEGRARNFQKIR